MGQKGAVIAVLGSRQNGAARLVSGFTSLLFAQLAPAGWQTLDVHSRGPIPTCLAAWPSQTSVLLSQPRHEQPLLRNKHIHPLIATNALPFLDPHGFFPPFLLPCLGSWQQPSSLWQQLQFSSPRPLCPIRSKHCRPATNQQSKKGAQFLRARSLGPFPSHSGVPSGERLRMFFGPRPIPLPWPTGVPYRQRTPSPHSLGAKQIRPPTA